MGLSDLFKDLDPKLADVLDQATRALRREFDEKLERATGVVSVAAADQGPPATAEPEPAEIRAAEPPEVGDLLDSVEELKHAVTTVDASGSQGEILEALVAGCARFSSRVAVFLLRGEDAFGWGGHGFERGPEDFKKTRLEIASVPAWAQLAQGAVALSAEQCRRVTDLLDAEAPQMGILLPFVLGNRPAAAIYCDRLGGEAALQISALQVLTFVASQVLENLPVRDRNQTATLRLTEAPAGEADSAVAAPEAAAPVAPTAPHEPAVPPAEPEPAPEPPEPEPAEPEAEEPEAEEPGEYEPEPPESEPQPPQASALESAPATMRPGPDAIDTGPPEALRPPDLGAEPPVEPAAGRFEEVSPEPAAVEAGSLPMPSSDLDPPMPTPDSAPSGPAAPPLPPVSTAPGIESSTQVAPPDDVQGPGWAFTAAPGGSESAESADEEEARRLARLLVTEIKLYNEEQVEQGRLKGNVYSLLREDIDRSRQIFEDRIDDEVRAAKDFFHEACVRILGGGDPSVLGF